MQAKTENIIKRIVDMVLTVLLMFLMAYQVTGDVLHEWLGIGMTATLVLHHILNRKWYKSVFKGKYSPYRITMTAVNTLMLISIALTALSGMSMSGHAVPFMYGFINVMTARNLHLAMSYWSFILMGIHIGLHMKAMTAKLPEKGKMIFKVILTGVSGTGLWLFFEKRYRELYHVPDALCISRLYNGKMAHYPAKPCNAYVFCTCRGCAVRSYPKE